MSISPTHSTASSLTSWEEPSAIGATLLNGLNLSEHLFAGEPNQVTAFFAEVRRYWLYSKVSHQIPIVIQGGTVLAKGIQSQAFYQLLLALRGTGSDDPGTWMAHPELIRLIGHARLMGGIIAIIAGVYTIIEQIIELWDQIQKKRSTEAIDAALNIADGVSITGGGVGLVTSGLSMAGYIGSEVIAWSAPLGLVSSALSLAYIGLQIRGISQSKDIIEHLSNENINESLEWLWTELADGVHKDGDYWLRRHFEVINREQYSAQIMHIIREQPNEREPLLQALRTRMTDKISSHKLAILSGIISLIGTALIFFGAIPLGWGFAIIGLAAILAFGRYVRDKRSTYRLEDKLDQLCQFDKIPTVWLEQYAKFALPVRHEHGDDQSPIATEDDFGLAGVSLLFS